MRFKKIGLKGIVLTCTIWLAFCGGALSFAQCTDDNYPADCGDGWCCQIQDMCVVPNALKELVCIKAQPNCLSEALYGEHSEETELLRNFRDNILSQTPAGQEIIKLYYEWSPVIVKAMEGDEEFKEEVKEMIDGVLELME